MYARTLVQQRTHLAFVDALGVLAALLSALFLRFNIEALSFGLAPQPAPWGDYLLASVPITISALLLFRGYGLYDLGLTRLEELMLLLKASTVAVMALLSITFFYRGYSFSRGTAILFYPLTIAWVFLGRLAYRRVRERVFGSRVIARRTLVIGAGTVGSYLVRQLQRRQSFYLPVGMLDDDPAKIGTTIDGVPVLGPIAELETIAHREKVDEVIVAFPSATHARIMQVLDQCLRLKLPWKVVPDLYDLMLDRFRVDAVGEVPLLTMKGSNIVGFNYALKRTLDLTASIAGLLAMGLPMLAIAAAIRLTSRGPALYKQTRLGYQGREFRLLKFRTMYTDNDTTIHRAYAKAWIEGKTGGAGEESAHSGGERAGVHKIVRDPRVTAGGRLLRKFSLDELPQVLNVLRGEMSLVGPRPPIPYEVQEYKEWHKRRFEAHPGITGLWQVGGRNRLSFDDMVRLDLEYLENWSLEMDARIFFKTIPVVLFGRAY
jgi:exopolysaccharide biosynthesis polyprenyl glycosylphosphotransferase